jgi:hypothetical protein
MVSISYLFSIDKQYIEQQIQDIGYWKAPYWMVQYSKYMKPVFKRSRGEICVYVLTPHVDQWIEEVNWYEWLTLFISVGDVPKPHPPVAGGSMTTLET